MAAMCELMVAWVTARLRLGTDRGASHVEYAVLVVVIALVCLVAVTVLSRTAPAATSSVGSTVR